MNILTKRYFPCSLNESAKVRVFAFPFAGAGLTAFDKFLPHVPNWIDFQPIRLPGRENRVSEPVITDIRKLVKMIAHAIRPLLDKPFAFLGVCYGGLLSYELALEIYQQTDWLPQTICFVASPAPSTLPRPNTIYDLPEASLIESLRSMEGMPAEILENDELLPIVLPAVRGDFKAIETYVPASPLQLLPVPFLLLGGTTDRAVKKHDLEAWSGLTSYQTVFHYYEGGHYFYHDCPEKIMDVMKSAFRNI